MTYTTKDLEQAHKNGYDEGVKEALGCVAFVVIFAIIIITLLCVL